jgi:hypothetical protein
MLNIIRQKREDVLQNNNTANASLLSLLEQLDKRTTEIVFTEPLHGNLDFKYLLREGFRNVKTIVLAEESGEITNIANLPAALKKLVCPNQLLITLENLPPSIEELDCRGNALTKMTLYGLKSLRILNASNNQLTELISLPPSLEELYCSHNQLSHLSLKNCQKLRVLHTSYNKAIIIEGVPESIVDFQSENSPYLEIQHDELTRESEEKTPENAQQKIDYIEGIEDYYKLKAKYETKNTEIRKKIYKEGLVRGYTKKKGRRIMSRVIPKCIHCDRSGGTLFFREGAFRKAICGIRSNPCSLNINIYTGDLVFSEELISITRGDLDDVRTDIIKQKLDTLFQYISSEQSTKQFKELMELYSEYNTMNHEYLEKYNRQYIDSDRIRLEERKREHVFELIGAIRTLVEEYEKTGNRELLNNAIYIQVRELNPELQNLQKLKNEVIEIEVDQFRDTKSYLIQRYVSLNKMEHNIGKDPEVLKYST